MIAQAEKEKQEKSTGKVFCFLQNIFQIQKKLIIRKNKLDIYTLLFVQEAAITVVQGKLIPISVEFSFTFYVYYILKKI